MICADPNETAPLWLKSDEKTPEESRPTFLVRFLTDSELRKLRRSLDEAAKSEDEEAAVAKVEAALRIGIVGAKNLTFRGNPLAFEQIQNFADYFTGREMWELAFGQIQAVTVGEQDRFSSASVVASAPGPSAADAKADDASMRPLQASL